MMIKTAGRPGLVNPIDFNERSTPRMTRATWVAIGIVGAAHLGLGAVIYYQRFEMPELTSPPAPAPFDITMVRPEPRPLPEPDPVPPTAPNTRVNETSKPVHDVETIVVTQGETVAENSTTLNLSTESPRPVDHATIVEPPRPQPPAIITNPSWSRQPSADQMRRAYPDRAITAGVGGSASLNCLVQANGAVSDCNVTQESPAGYGFGRAADSLSRHFRVNPRTVNGAAQGSRVNINLRFSVPDA